MNNKLPLGFLSLVFWQASAYSACDTTPLANNDLQRFRGETVSFNCISSCASWMTSAPVDWHETHVAGGNLEEVGKEGTPEENLQPRAVVGSWRVNNNQGTDGDQICYTYTGDTGGEYCYVVYGTTPVSSGNSYEFCNASGHKATGTVDF